jgi:hypothetical protein
MEQYVVEVDGDTMSLCDACDLGNMVQSLLHSERSKVTVRIATDADRESAYGE